MKPRLESARLTTEDWFARAGLYAARPPAPWRGRLQDVGFESDRRDADLMLEAREAGAVSITVMRATHGRHEVSVWWQFHLMGGRRKSW